MASNITTHHLRLPVSVEDLQPLSPGDVVYLNGVLYTAREGVYRRILDEAITPPVVLSEISNVNFHCSPAARVCDTDYEVGAVTATASFRFSHWMAAWLDRMECRLILGKGGMSGKDYREIFVPRQAIYLTTVGYGTGALLGRGVKRVENVYWLEELGIAQAIWVLQVENFGPFLVDSDLQGRSLFERENEMIDGRIKELYQGLREPALSRYGETTRRGDEVI